MLRYIEKGIGLHDAITEAGHELSFRDGEWVCSDEAAVQAIIDAYQPPAPRLNNRQFRMLLRMTGWEDIWNELEALLRQHDRRSYALLAASREQDSYDLGDVLAEIGIYQATAKSMGFDISLTEAEITALWHEIANLQNG